MINSEVDQVILKSISNRTITFEMCKRNKIPDYYIETDSKHGKFDVWATKSYLSRKNS